MSDIKLKQMETKAVEAVRRAFASLQNDAVLPETMTFPLGEMHAEFTYTFELRVSMRAAEKSDEHPAAAHYRSLERCICADESAGECPIHR